MAQSLHVLLLAALSTLPAIHFKSPARAPVKPAKESKTQPAPAPKSLNPVQLTVVDYKQLRGILKAHRGRIIVMDVWAQFCQPCRRQFPRLVKLHHDYADRGVVCVSVSVDDPEERDSVLKYLKSKKATITNFLLDEDPSVWQDKWDITAIPAVFVYGVDGKIAARFDHNEPQNDFTYDDVEDAVDELLKRGTASR
jgi:thiol-disulfide isomerase/thioredoxin